MKRFLFLSLLAAALCARAEVFVVELPSARSPDSAAASLPVEISDAGFVTGFSCLSPYGSQVGAPSLCLVRESRTNAAVVARFAFTNFTYSISFTNGAVTVTNTAVRPYEAFPPTLTGYWTNATVRAWAETNWVPARCACSTNFVAQPPEFKEFDGNRLSATNDLRIGVAPGDRLFFQHSSDDVEPGERVTVWIEH